jgi:hypothetical protein
MYLTNYSLLHEGVWGSACIDPRFLDLGASWRRMVSFTPRPLNLRGKSRRYPLYKRLGGPQNRSGRRGGEEILNPTGTRIPTNSGSAYCNSDDSCPLSSRLSEAIKICETITLSLVLYGCEIWSLSLMEEHRLRVFENRVLRAILVLRGSMQEGDGKYSYFINGSFTKSTPHHVYIFLSFVHSNIYIYIYIWKFLKK